MRDLLLMIRADECVHREMNHYVADIYQKADVENYIHEVELKSAKNFRKKD